MNMIFLVLGPRKESLYKDYVYSNSNDHLIKNQKILLTIWYTVIRHFDKVAEVYDSIT